MNACTILLHHVLMAAASAYEVTSISSLFFDTSCMLKVMLGHWLLLAEEKQTSW